jgi:transcriptional regulator with XRE-family HTH domain
MAESATFGRQQMGFSGERLRQHRRLAGLSQVKLAELLGTTRVVIYNYESGRKEPKLPRAQQLARIFGVMVDDLLEPEEQPW